MNSQRPTVDGNLSSRCLPLHIQPAEKQAIVRLIFDPNDRYLWLSKEKELQNFATSTLKLLGITTREAEVLFWLAKDKSNAAIAKIIGCREGTVRKHLEHIYTKLGVQTRTAAVMVAMERLGLFTAEFITISS